MNLKNLVNALEEQNISLAELSRRTGVPKSTLSSWLRGSSPNLEQLNKVAEYLSLSIDFLAFDKKEKISSELLLYKALVTDGTIEIVIKKISGGSKNENS
jgi:transcriptional regulator with XRE-family HTH domain